MISIALLRLVSFFILAHFVIPQRMVTMILSSCACRYSFGYHKLTQCDYSTLTYCCVLEVEPRQIVKVKVLIFVAGWLKQPNTDSDRYHVR